jgi:hypothetical protein
MVAVVRQASSTKTAQAGGRRRRLVGQEASHRARETQGSGDGGRPWPGTAVIAEVAPWWLSVTTSGLAHGGWWLECDTARVEEAGTSGLHQGRHVCSARRQQRRGAEAMACAGKGDGVAPWDGERAGEVQFYRG